MKVSFQPLRTDAIVALSYATGLNYDGAEFSNERDWFCCTVRNEFDMVALVIVFEFKSWCDAHVTTALFDRRALTRRLLTTVIKAVFTRAARITALVDPNNQAAINQVWRMGFRHEGFMRRALDGRRDAMLFGLIPEDCPYLSGTPFRIIQAVQTHPQQPGMH